MRKRARNLLTILLTTVVAAACGSNYEAPPAAESAAAPQQQTGAPTATQAGALPGTGPVLETMNAGGYSYVNVDLGGTPVWAAGPQVKVKVGDVVTLPDGMAMRGYHSKSLDRTFEVVYFVGGIDVQGGATIKQDLGGSSRSRMAVVTVEPGSVTRAEGGKTVEEVMTGAADLAGQGVTLRGRVVKFNSGIIGTNWLHLQDGSGAAGSNDLTITTSAVVAVGDMVVVRGKVTTDKDFGAGYKYAVIIEDAEVTKE